MDNIVIVNGVQMSLKEYKKLKKASQPKKKVSKRNKENKSEINLIYNEINSMMKKVKLIRSLSSYYDNAYKQWGIIGRNIISRKEIQSPFVRYRLKARELHNTICEIYDISKKNEKSIYQYIEKLSYQLDDLKTCIDKLCHGISESGVMDLYGDHESINGFGRRLGLKTLVSRTWSAVNDINSIIKKCQDIYNGGVDPFSYTKETYNGLINCWSKKY